MSQSASIKLGFGFQTDFPQRKPLLKVNTSPSIANFIPFNTALILKRLMCLYSST